MGEDEINLLACIQKLKLVPRSKPGKVYRDENSKNPFARRSNITKPQSHVSFFGPTCTCKKRRLFKKPPLKTKNKILREPIIIIDKCIHSDNNMNSRLFGECSSAQQDFKSIVTGCEQLSLSSDRHEFPDQNFRETKNVQRVDKVSSSCSQQAMAQICVNPPCDVTIDELASYFETLVHIPKKMSSMAEMMYI